MSNADIVAAEVQCASRSDGSGSEQHRVRGLRARASTRVVDEESAAYATSARWVISRSIEAKSASTSIRAASSEATPSVTQPSASRTFENTA